MVNTIVYTYKNMCQFQKFLIANSLSSCTVRGNHDPCKLPVCFSFWRQLMSGIIHYMIMWKQGVMKSFAFPDTIEETVVKS